MNYYYFYLLLIPLFFYTQTLKAQIYLQYKAGYNFAAFNDDLGSPLAEIGTQDLTILEDGTVSEKTLFGTNGAGFSTAFSVGYLFTEHFGLELMLEYVKSPKLRLAEQNTLTYKAFHDIHTWRVQATPQFVVQSGGEVVNFYQKTGILLPFAGVNKSEGQVTDKEGTLARLYGYILRDQLPFEPTEELLSNVQTEVDIKANSYADFSYGFSSTVGMNVYLSDYFSIFGETTMTALTVRAKNTEYTQFDQVSTLSGLELLQNTLETLPTYLIETVYVSELTEQSNQADYNPNYNLQQAQEEVAFKLNFNSIGLHLGLRWEF